MARHWQVRLQVMASKCCVCVLWGPPPSSLRALFRLLQTEVRVLQPEVQVLQTEVRVLQTEVRVRVVLLRK